MFPLGLLSAGAFVRRGFYPLGLLSVGAFIRVSFFGGAFDRGAFVRGAFVRAPIRLVLLLSAICLESCHGMSFIFCMKMTP